MCDNNRFFFFDISFNFVQKSRFSRDFETRCVWHTALSFNRKNFYNRPSCPFAERAGNGSTGRLWR